MPGVWGARILNVKVAIRPGKTKSSEVVASRLDDIHPSAIPSSACFGESPITPRVTCLSVPRCQGMNPRLRKRTVYVPVPPGASAGDGSWSTNWAWNANAALLGDTVDTTTPVPTRRTARITVPVTIRMKVPTRLRTLIASADLGAERGRCGPPAPSGTSDRSIALSKVAYEGESWYRVS